MNTRTHTARIRQALADLPSSIKSNDLDDVREILHEIIGSASAVAEELGIDL